MTIKRHIQILAFLSVAIITTTSQAEDDMSVTPYRPSVSSPAQLPTPGQLEFELGGLHARTGSDRRDSLPYQFKLAFNQQWGLLVGGEAYVSARDATNSRERGIGDTTLVLKRAFLLDDISAFGLEFGAKLPTAKDTIGSGKSDYTLNGIFSRDIDKLHIDTNLNFTRLGAFDTGTSRTQTGMSMSFSLPVADKWGANAELSGTHRRGVSNAAQLLVAATYSPCKQMTMDFGITKGLEHGSPDLSVFGGIVVPLAKLW